MTVKEFYVTDAAIVDNKQWYTVITGKKSTDWLSQQDCYKHSVALNMFDVPEELLVLLRLKWPA